MMPTLLRTLLSFFLLCCLSSYAFAQETQSTDDLYAEAIKLISEQHYLDAQNLLIKVIERTPQHAGAWLDLAIVQCELGNKDEADHLFNVLALRFSPPTAILEVINKQKIENCSAAKKKNQYSISFERGYDSNINQGASNSTYLLGSGATQIELQLLPEYLPKHDHFNMISLSTSLQHPASNVAGFLQLNIRKYDQYSSFNTASLSTGINKTWGNENWTTQLSLSGAYLLLDNTLYQKQASAYLVLTPTTQSHSTFKYNLSAGINSINYPTLLNFGSNIFELRSQFFADFDQFQTLTSFAAMYDRANLERPGGNRTGYFASVALRKKIASQIESELSWNRQIWRSSTSYSPGLINDIRKQNNEGIKIALSYLINRNQSITLELGKFNNKENISFLQYNNKSIHLNWNWKN